MVIPDKVLNFNPRFYVQKETMFLLVLLFGLAFLAGLCALVHRLRLNASESPWFFTMPLSVISSAFPASQNWHYVSYGLTAVVAVAVYILRKRQRDDSVSELLWSTDQSR